MFGAVVRRIGSPPSSLGPGQHLSYGCAGWSQVGRDGPLADLLGQCDDDALGAAEVTEPVAVLVLRHLAEEFGAVGAQAGKDVLDVFDGEHNAMQAQRVGRWVLRLGAGRRRRVELRQLQLAVPVWGPHHGDITTHAVESDGAVRPASLDLRLALQLKSELGEERDGGI